MMNHEHYSNLLAGKHRTIESNKKLGCSLGFIAGAINAGGFMLVGQYTSHMTGIISLAADDVALNQFLPAVYMLLYIFCFICGAALTTMLIIWGRNHNLHSRYALPFVAEALLLVLLWVVSFSSQLNTNYVIAMLCFLMGLQNSVITKISETAIRTTHITGMATDIGIEIGRIIYSIFGKQLPKVQYNKERIKLHMSIVTLFFLGGITGAFGFKIVGAIFVLPIAIYLLFLAFYPIWHDYNISRYLSKRKQRSH